jgi:CDP-diacylglycerol--serine O-phosphatidyltransferase
MIVLLISLPCMKIKQHIPNTITCCNLLCGCLAIVQAFEGNLVWTAYLVGLAAIFDFFDGFAARLLRVTSPIGKDLDSLADMVTFGVVPGIVMFQLISFSTIYLANGPIYPPLSALPEATKVEYPVYAEYLKYIAFIVPIFSAIRLAKFNNDTRQTTSFIGLPTPANAIFICSIPLIIDGKLLKFFSGHADIYISDIFIAAQQPLSQSASNNLSYDFLLNPYILIGIIVVLSFLLVSEIPLFALKFKFFGWKGNRVRYVFLGLSLLLLITLQFVGIPLIIILYVLMSLITNAYLKRRTAS